MESNRYRLPENVLRRIQLILTQVESFRLNPGRGYSRSAAGFWQSRLGRFELHEFPAPYETYLVKCRITLSPTTGLSREEFRQARGKALGIMTLYSRGQVVAQAVLQATGRIDFACAWVFFRSSGRRFPVPTSKLTMDLKELT